MNQLIIGYGNTLRADDAFGVDVLAQLEQKVLKNTTLLSAFQLTPEMALELLDYSHIVFIDTAYCSEHEYVLACSLENSNGINLSHHISAFHLIDIVNSLYKHCPSFEIFSMLGRNFESITDEGEYKSVVHQTVEFLAQQPSKKNKGF